MYAQFEISKGNVSIALNGGRYEIIHILIKKRSSSYIP